MMKQRMKSKAAFWFAAMLAIKACRAADPSAQLDQCNVTWTTPSDDSRGSMPLGNGDIGLNVWMEKSGDLLFYISKTDAWSDNVGRNKGLVKLGRVRVKFLPALDAGARFSQTLRLRDGEIAITAGETKLRVWVDANRPVVHMESDSLQPEAMQVAFETLRSTPEQDLQADKLLDAQTNRIVWCYRNQNKTVSELTNLTFGAAISGDDLVSAGGAVLKSAKPAKRQVISICALTAHAPTPEAWLAALLYTLQLYFDFSGYSDMALGLALLMNVRIPLNFNSPYKSARADRRRGFGNRTARTLRLVARILEPQLGFCQR